ncbi:MAG: UbiA family prenyltransferase [Endozoicomonas sp.]
MVIAKGNPEAPGTILTLLRLGRVSNLPTVWSNVLAGAALSGGVLQPVSTMMLLSALSLMYIGGMFLNDALDAEWDRKHGLNRPIPDGEIARSTVLASAILLLLAGQLLIFSLYFFNPERVLFAAVSGAALILFIFLYNWSHKWFSHSTWLMGACRFMIYLTTAAVLGTVTHDLILGGFALLLYIVGVTYLARTEYTGEVIRLWPLFLLFMPLAISGLHVKQSPVTLVFMALFLVWLIRPLVILLSSDNRKRPKAVGGMLAAIPLIDASYLAMTGALPQALLCLMLFFLVLYLHRLIAGT